jgi:hypothetical protein
MTTGGSLRKRTPLEQAAFEATRRGRYEKLMREQGFRKVSIWLPVDCEADVRQLVKLLGSTNGALRASLRKLVSDA